jgi:predicted  nucleic acid-binding Zn-ribbon protein
MTPQEKEIQELRQELKKLNKEHQLDMAEIARQRRQIELMEQELEKEIRKHHEDYERQRV